MKRTARAKGAGKSKWLEVFEKLQKELRDGVYPQGVYASGFDEAVKPNCELV